MKAAKPRSRRKTAREKLDIQHPSHGQAFPIPPAMRRSLGEGTMMVPRPTDVEAVMKGVRKGRIMTMSELRAALARQATERLGVKVDQCCPLTTGIFARLAAEAAEEEAEAGKKRITPYWRTVRDNGAMNEKFPGGVVKQAARLRKEGVKLKAARGKSGPRVEGLGSKK